MLPESAFFKLWLMQMKEAVNFRKIFLIENKKK